ncbi:MULTISPECIES: hypothetical protein [Methylobacterium]|nr:MULTISPECIES: hypothetical protein [Methylobacterium]TXM88101.1 hypothetical protein FV219_24990 [Methylobacterium sp. WL122]TXN80547.1 hypothetical protein FV234_16525 [Methylobacterium sp. WL8]
MSDFMVSDNSKAGKSGSVVLYVPSRSAGFDPETALRLIAQASEGMHRLEAWRQTIQIQANKLVYQVQREREAFAADIDALNYEIVVLRREVTELQAALTEARIAKDASAMQCEAARTRAADADRKTLAAEERAQTAEDWLVRLQGIISDEFSAS